MNAAELQAILEPHGPTDQAYLDTHFPRFQYTFDAFSQGHEQPLDVLDVGAHWLHQSVLWSRAGHRVTALDLPVTLERESVHSLAMDEDIRLMFGGDLSKPQFLSRLADERFDVILFTEVLEHLAFSPVELLRQLARITRRGGRIILTTPNFYAVDRLVRSLTRLLRGQGGGVRVADLLEAGPVDIHWKEYSIAELSQLVRGIPGLRMDTLRRVTRLHHRGLAGRMARAVETVVPPLRSQLYAEILATHDD